MKDKTKNQKAKFLKIFNVYIKLKVNFQKPKIQVCQDYPEYIYLLK